MQVVKYIVVISFILSCNTPQINRPIQTSKWLSLKDSFAIRNAEEFRLDNNFDYKNLHKISCKLLDSTQDDLWCKAYLHSWQERDSSFIEFTAVVVEEDRGIRIMYYLFSKSDSLISETPVAWGSVSDYYYQQWSRFSSKDTLISTHSITKYLKSGNTKGDTSIYKIAFNKDGRVSKKIIYEKNELKLD